MRKTILLCFIHGFKGGEDTFGDKYVFTEDLRRRLSRELPKVDIKIAVYPKFETRGDLKECVARFRDWLQEKVIDLEVAANTPSPTVDPSVHTILIGHSMGGIVAAETVISLTTDTPIDDSSSDPPSTANIKSGSQPLNSMMFPYIQGVLAFDTPYLGIAPGVVAHGAEGHYSKASAALTQLSGLTGALWGSGKAADAAGQAKKQPVAALPAPPVRDTAKTDKKDGLAATPAAAGGWGSWGKVALYAGAGAAALAAAGGAAYIGRNTITEGWTWTSSHLEFVGCLARGEELRRRVAHMVRCTSELNMGFGNLYTRLGAEAQQQQQAGSVVGSLLPTQRTFCNLPRNQGAGDWRPAVNDAAGDETWAHMTMFERAKNPGYEKLLSEASGMIAGWTKGEWYDGSEEATMEVQ